MVKRFSNDEASASGIITLVAVFLLAGFLLIVNGYVMDQITGMLYTSSIFSGASATQLRFDVVNLQVMIIRFSPILILVALGINAIINSNRELSSVSPLSSIAMGAADMILTNVVILAVTLFAGFGLDKIIATMTSLNLGAQQTGLYNGLVSSVPSVFYGVMFLAMIGSCILFVMNCVQVVDYSSSYT